MVTFPTPSPSLFPAERPRGSPAWINTSPTAGQIAGKPPIDAPATVEAHPSPGVQPSAHGLPTMPTAGNTGS
jgi:hypothetical protein